jgi:hypothetical protein
VTFTSKAQIHPNYRESINRRIMVQACQGINTKPYSKNKESKKGLGDMAQVVEHLPSKCQDPEFKFPHQKKKNSKDYGVQTSCSPSFNWPSETNKIHLKDFTVITNRNNVHTYNQSTLMISHLCSSNAAKGKSVGGYFCCASSKY